jgi:nucleoside-triphosphatase THEP1
MPRWSGRPAELLQRLAASGQGRFYLIDEIGKLDGLSTTVIEAVRQVFDGHVPALVTIAL